MDSQDYAADIPLDLAVQAHRGTSFSPEKRGENEQKIYSSTLASEWSTWSKFAAQHGTEEVLNELFPQYREALRKKTIAYLEAKSRCISTMIAGPANFPVRRAEKANESAAKRAGEVADCCKSWQNRLRKALNPNYRLEGPIMSGDSDAVERLRAEIDKLQAKQDHMKAVNAALRKHAKGGLEAQVVALIQLGLSEEPARALAKGEHGYPPGYQHFELSNNNANLNRLKKRLVAEERAHATPVTTIEGENARLEDCPPENRVRLFYPDKPGPTVRGQLKKAGFRWAPSLGCWQAYRNSQSLARARELAGNPVAAEVSNG